MDINDRLLEIEARLAKLEELLIGEHDPTTDVVKSVGLVQDSPCSQESVPKGPPTAVKSSTLGAKIQAGRPASIVSSEITPTSLMALTAAGAFVLAAIYFIKLVYQAGWLTPTIQIGLASMSGISLIVGGIYFSRRDRDYSAWLPAIGLVVLYLAVYAGHLYHKLFSTPIAIAAVSLVTLTGIWLSRRFNNSVYTLFAVVGVYLTPLFIPVIRTDILDLVIYFTAWSLLFSIASLQEGRRLTYMMAMFFAVIGFDLAWRHGGEPSWAMAAVYQFIQFLIFSLTAFLFSVRRRETMSSADALIHGVGLFYFYAIEYILLKQNIPAWAPYASLVSVGVVIGLYVAARQTLGSEKQATHSGGLVSAYASIVTAHVVFFELVPTEYIAWATLLLPLVLRLAQHTFKGNQTVLTPIFLVGGILFLFGFVSALSGGHATTELPLAIPLLYLYSGLLYVCFYSFRRDYKTSQYAGLMLYAGHVALLVASVRTFDSGVLISLFWGGFAVTLLLTAIRRDDTLLAQSSLLIFAASSLKVLLYDLSESNSMARVIVLVILAASLYGGGWLYQKISTKDVTYTGNLAVDHQIRLINKLVSQGKDSDAIVAHLKDEKIPCFSESGEWDVAQIDKICVDFKLNREGSQG